MGSFVLVRKAPYMSLSVGTMRPGTASVVGGQIVFRAIPLLVQQFVWKEEDVMCRWLDSFMQSSLSGC